MTDVAGEDSSPEKKSGCGILGAVFGRRSFWPRRATSTGSLPGLGNNNVVRVPSSPISKRRRGSSDDANFFDSAGEQPRPPAAVKVNPGDRIIARPTPGQPRAAPPAYQQKNIQEATAQPASAKMPMGMATSKNSPQQQNGSQYQSYGGGGQNQNQNRKVPKEAIGISGELENIIAEHQKSRGGGNLVRASSSNVMLFGNLGNLGGGSGVGGYSVSSNATDHLPKPARESSLSNPTSNGTSSANSVVGNYTPSGASKANPLRKASETGSLCRALSTRMDPEQLKIMGNEDYKNGRFAEALALYDAAISIDPNKASYRSNKSAALTALGQLLEAVFECREAIRIDPQYQRAHQRLASLYLRLGEADKAMYHHKHAGSEADPEVASKTKNLQAHLSKCTEAKKTRDWNTLIKETGLALAAGADSAPMIFALQAEAFLKLRRHQDADETLAKGPHLDVDACTKFLGPIGNANLLMITAQVDLAAGRFDDALEAAQKATRLDVNSREASTVAKRARAVAQARSQGNQLFKAGKFSEALSAYANGLDHDPYNSVLLCNRAACSSKLEEFERAVEDCTAALGLRPSYTKARLRRADCNAKLGRLEAAMKDYEILHKEAPEDEEVSKALAEVQSKVQKQRGGGDAES
uniref:Uncharacterized protein n=1 Tax=Kalanchoe fedtschenkoi TaxID=63787 RepID=A0A7N0T905_KALFE